MSLDPVEVAGDAPVREILHRADGPDGLVLTHGAGGNKDVPLLVAVAAAFAAAGVTVLRCDLPYRQARPRATPSPRGAPRDREGLRAALAALRERVSGRLFLGGHSYGGRMASMLLAEDPALASALLLQSYPLHPPGQAQRLRTEHLPRLRTPTAFVHGTTDPFATLRELEAARVLVPARTALLTVAGGHDLGWGRRRGDDKLPARIVQTLLAVASG